MTREGSFIETGVDKLVQLVEAKKRISTADAAKALGVSTAVIEEWADFLEEEGIISIEYKLATTYLVERKLSKKEVVKKAKEFHGTKDAFIRKIETAMQGIDRDTGGLDSLREQFISLKKDLGDDLGNVKAELKQLEEYEILKKNIDKQIYDQQQDFRKKIEEMEKDLVREKSKYKEIIDDLEVEKIKLEEEKSEILSLRDQENKLLKNLDNFKVVVEQIKTHIKDEEQKMNLTEEHIKYLESVAEKVKEEIKVQREKLNPIIEMSRKQEESIVKIQEEVIRKVAKGSKQITDNVKEGERVAEGFKVFFDKKTQIDHMLETIDKDKDNLHGELNELIRKAHAFDLASKNSNVKKYMTELEQKFKDIERKRSLFKGELDKLVQLVRRNF
jgi:chromosome segregation ATPase